MPQPERKAPSARRGFEIDKPTLSGHEKVQLLNTVQTGGWQVVLDILELCCEFAETEHWRLKPTDHSDSAIARNQAETRGQRLLFERLQTKIRLEVESILNAEQPPLVEDEEDSEERILDPTK